MDLPNELVRHVNVTTGLISQWERGERRPSSPALTLLALIKRPGLEVLEVKTDQ